MGNRISANAPLKVLFIGNSFTARKDLPGLIARLAAAAAPGSSTQPRVSSRARTSPCARRNSMKEAWSVALKTPVMRLAAKASPTMRISRSL